MFNGIGDAFDKDETFIERRDYAAESPGTMRSVLSVKIRGSHSSVLDIERQIKQILANDNSKGKAR